MAASLCCVATNASAYTTGISGYSGKDGKTCTECHAPASAKPSATIKGPTTLAPGTSGTYQLVVDTDVTSSASAKRQVGFDVATSAGALGTVDQTNPTRLLAGELSHTNALPAAQSVAVSFTLTAPASDGTVTLFAAALSADGDGTNNGDSTTTATLDVHISSAPLDLAGVDAVSSATAVTPSSSTDLGPPRDEPRWSCGTYVGAPLPLASAPLALLLLLYLTLRVKKRS
jgi:hypothetical protein